MHSALLQKLTALSGRTARFRRVALHLHSPDSRDWGRDAVDATRNDRTRFSGSAGLQAFADELRRELDLVAVTDHMRCGFAAQLSSCCRRGDEFLILPGMEVNFRPESALGCIRIHLVVILPEGTGPPAFERLFMGLGSIPHEDALRTGQEEITGIPLRDWVVRVHGEGGLCIAAHVDNSQGVRRCFRQTAVGVLKLFSDAGSAAPEEEHEIGQELKEYLFESGVDAVEVRKPSERLSVFRSLLEEHVAVISAEVESLQKQLREGFATDASKQKAADLRANAEQRLNRVAALRNEYLQRWAALRRLLDERDLITDDLAAVQNQIAGIRVQHNATVEQTLNRFFSQQLRVSIEFRAGGDTDECEKAAKKLVAGAKRYQARELGRLVSRHCNPVTLARLLRSGNLAPLIGKTATFDDTTSEFTLDDAAAIVAKTKPFEYDDHAQVDILSEDSARLNAVLDLEEVEWDDYETILLDGRPVNEKSPGQRSSAMLPLIALAERTPLVIDQPEDNLDKKLIGNVLVGILSELKEQRQIIVCTHDPNILVGGDAEQVVVLEAESDRRASVAKHGSIDNDDIVQVVVDILEGGAEAFITRGKRYGERVGFEE